MAEKRETEARLQRLEEAALYGDHRGDRLDEALRQLDAVVQRLSRRVEAIERRLGELAARQTGAETPAERDRGETSSDADAAQGP